MASPNRTYRRQEGNGALAFVAGAQAVQQCPVCLDDTGSVVGVGEVQVSKKNQRRYQRCVSADQPHVLFLGKDVIPLALQAGLSMPIPPPILDRGVVQGGKVRCAAPDCPRSRGHRNCATKRCARCCAQAGAAERQAGRDGSLLCSVHKGQILQAIASLNLPPPELLRGSNEQSFASQGSSTTSSSPLTPLQTPESDPSASRLNPKATGSQLHERQTNATPGASGSNSRMDGIPAVRVGNLETGQSTRIPRQVPRAMPVNLEFTRTAPGEKSRIERAIERATREDRVEITLSFWHDGKKANFSTRCDPFTFCVEDHDDLDFIIKKYGGVIFERYDARKEEWVIQSTKAPWDITGQRHLLLRTEGVTDEDCPGLSEDETAVKTTPASNVTVYYTPDTFPSSPPGPNSSPSILAAKRKAEASLDPGASKFARLEGPAIEPEPTPLRPTTNNRSRSGDSFLLDLTYSEVEQGMEYLRVLCVHKGKELSQAFKEVFPNAFYTATTFRRHRDLYFSTTPALLQEWNEEHGERLWRAFYNLRTTTKNQYEASNRWYATAEEKEAVRQRRRRAHQQAADAQRELLARRRVRPSETNGDETIKEEDDDDTSVIVKQEVDDNDGAIIKQEVKEPTIKSEERGWSWIAMDSDDDDELDVERQLTRLDKGKGRAGSTASSWQEWEKGGPSESEDAAKLKIASTSQKRPESTFKPIYVGVIELSDTESEPEPEPAPETKKPKKVEVIYISD